MKMVFFFFFVAPGAPLKSGSLCEFDLVSFPSFDDLGSISDFNSRELVFSLLGQAESLAKRDGILLVQTTYPDNFLLTSFQEKNYEIFFDKELKERKKTSAPPFSRLVRLLYRGKAKR